MIEWPSHLKEGIRKFIFTDTGFLYEIYFSTPEDLLYPEFPQYTFRYIILCSFTNAALYEPWANDELRLLLKEMLNRGMDIPDVMNHWSYRIATNSAFPAMRNRSSASLRNIRMQMFVTMGCEFGLQRKVTIDLLCQALDMEENSVNSALLRAKKAQEQAQLCIDQGSVRPAVMWSSPSEEGPCSARHRDQYT